MAEYDKKNSGRTRNRKWRQVDAHNHQTSCSSGLFTKAHVEVCANGSNWNKAGYPGELYIPFKIVPFFQRFSPQ